MTSETPRDEIAELRAAESAVGLPAGAGIDLLIEHHTVTARLVAQMEALESRHGTERDRLRLRHALEKVLFELGEALIDAKNGHPISVELVRNAATAASAALIVED